MRALAHQFDLPTKDRKDSQGICFLGKLKFHDFVEHYCGTKQGNLVEKETDMVVGTHKGFWFYTIGQRQGLGLSGGPWYVVDKDIQKNIVYISSHYYSPEKKRDTFELDACNWFTSAPQEPKNLMVKLRHGAQKHASTITPHQNGRFLVKLHDRDQGIAAGQFAVFYNDTDCLGGGVITHVQR